MWVAFAFAKLLTFFSQKICELDIVVTRIVDSLTTFGLVKLTTLWTTEPWWIGVTQFHTPSKSKRVTAIGIGNIGIGKAIAKIGIGTQVATVCIGTLVTNLGTGTVFAMICIGIVVADIGIDIIVTTVRIGTVAAKIRIGIVVGNINTGIQYQQILAQ